MKNWAGKGWLLDGGGGMRNFRFPQFSFPAIKVKYVREGEEEEEEKRRAERRGIVGPNITKGDFLLLLSPPKYLSDMPRPPILRERENATYMGICYLFVISWTIYLSCMED